MIYSVRSVRVSKQTLILISALVGYSSGGRVLDDLNPMPISGMSPVTAIKRVLDEQFY